MNLQESVTDYRGVWVLLEQKNGEIESVSLEVLSKARELADQLKEKLTGVLLGHQSQTAENAAKYGADKILFVDHPNLADYSLEPYAEVMTKLVVGRKPSILLIGATRNGTDLAGRLAVRLRTGLTAHVVRLEIEEKTKLLVGAVPGFGGRILALCKCERSRPQMATVKPGIFTRPEPSKSTSADIETIPMEVPEPKTKVIERSVGEVENIADAERIVIAGLGTGGDLSLTKQLAEALNAVIGVTRPLADKGYATRDYQVGSSGVAVRSKVAVVLGASGSSYFTSGIDGVEKVIAIDANREAPIFEHADYCVVGDLFKILPPLISQLRDGGGTPA